MTINNNTIISISTELLRDVVNAITPVTDDHSPLDQLMKITNIKTKEDWYVICSAMDLLGDTELAKENYLKFKLDGPTKYDEMGERYLRLYGILNSIFLQKEAIISLLQYSNVGNLKDEKRQLENVDILKLRHIAGAHTMNYKDYDLENRNTQKYSYMIARYSLDGKTISFRNVNGVEEINIDKSLFEFNKVAAKKMYIVLTYFMNILKSTDRDEYEDKVILFDLIKNYIEGQVHSFLDNTGEFWHIGDIDWENDESIEVFTGEKE
jgi:hypothetical protein